MKPDYTKKFETIKMTKGQIPEFPFDLIMPSKEKCLEPKGIIYQHSSMATTTPNKQGPAFIYGGDFVMVPTFCVAATGESENDVRIEHKTKLNEYCKEMIEFEQKNDFVANVEHRIIVSMYDLSVYDDPVDGGYYGFNEIGFLILGSYK